MTAILGFGIDADVPAHYGDPLGEQRLLADSAALVDRSNRDVLVVPGADRLPWLHSIISQHVSGLVDGESAEALVLSANGHVEQHWQLTELGGQVWIDTEPAAGGAALEYLLKMRFLKRVEPAAVDFGVWTLAGPAARFDVALGRAVPYGEGFVRNRNGEFDFVLPRGVLPPVDVPRAGMMAYEALRVAAVRPRVGFETDHRTIPHEVGWIGSAVHLNKGCYRGQETVARVHNLGRPPRRLVLLHLSGMSDVLPEPGTPVLREGRAVGFLGTAVHHYELGPIALAVIKRTVEDGLSVDGQPVATA